MKYLLALVISLSAHQAFTCDSLKLIVDKSFHLNDLTNPRTFSVQIDKTGPACDFFITFERGNSSTFERSLQNGSRTLKYNIFTDLGLSRILKDYPEISEAHILKGRFQRVGQETMSLTAAIFHTPEQFIPSGVYSDLIRAKIYKGSFSAPPTPELDSKFMRFSYRQAPIQQVAVTNQYSMGANLRQHHIINFGSLKEGAKKYFDIVVKANEGHRVLISSQNAGRLKKNDREKFVGYNLELNSLKVPLTSSPTLITSGIGPTPAQGLRIPAEITILSLRDAMAGQYSDALTITIQAN